MDVRGFCANPAQRHRRQEPAANEMPIGIQGNKNNHTG